MKHKHRRVPWTASFSKASFDCYRLCLSLSCSRSLSLLSLNLSLSNEGHILLKTTLQLQCATLCLFDIFFNLPWRLCVNIRRLHFEFNLDFLETVFQLILLLSLRCYPHGSLLEISSATPSMHSPIKKPFKYGTGTKIVQRVRDSVPPRSKRNETAFDSEHLAAPLNLCELY